MTDTNSSNLSKAVMHAELAIDEAEAALAAAVLNHPQNETQTAAAALWIVEQFYARRAKDLKVSAAAIAVLDLITR
jgi:hypothetical protein